MSYHHIHHLLEDFWEEEGSEEQGLAFLSISRSLMRGEEKEGEIFKEAGESWEEIMEVGDGLTNDLPRDMHGQRLNRCKRFVYFVCFVWRVF